MPRQAVAWKLRASSSSSNTIARSTPIEPVSASTSRSPISESESIETMASEMLRTASR